MANLYWESVTDRQTENCSRRLNEALQLSDIGLDLTSSLRLTTECNVKFWVSPMLQSAQCPVQSTYLTGSGVC